MRWIFILIIALLIGLFSVYPVYAGPTVDNLLGLNVHNKGANVGIAIFTGYPSAEYNRATLRSVSPNTAITINTPIDKPIVDSWLYIYTSGYNTEAYSKIIVNDQTVVDNKHIFPTGEDRNRQLLRVDNVSQYIGNITEVSFRISAFGGSSEIHVDGASLVVVYEDTALREYWIYDGTEFLSAGEASEGTQSDQSYTRTFLDPQYTSPKSADLYVVYHNYRQPNDKLEFNGNELEDSSAETLVDTEYLNIMKFDVKSLLTTPNSVTFTSPRFSNTDIYPSIALLSVETQDTTPPAVTIISPTDELVRGEIEITGSVDDPTATLAILIDGEEKSTSLPYTWNTSSVVDGSYDINVEATDPASNKGTKTITVEVDNTPPSVSISSPMNGSDIEGTVDVTGTATDANIDTISLKIDGAEVSSTLPYSWNTSSYSNGSHTVELTATDKLGNTATTTIEVNIVPTVAVPTTTVAPTTPPPTTLPPSTVVPTTIPPQTTTPPLNEVDIGIQILSISPQPAIEGEEVEIKLLIINYGDKTTEGKVELYVGDESYDRLLTERVKIDAGASKTLVYTINVKDSRVYEGPGRYKIKAEITNVGLDIVDPNEANNEVIDSLKVEKKPSRISLAIIWPIVKWVAIIAVIIAVLRVIQIQMSSERDYLR
ncbi:MAG: DUF3344 domain-containing protein [Candidatus Hydrothermarchaeales archaeon]